MAVPTDDDPRSIGERNSVCSLPALHRPGAGNSCGEVDQLEVRRQRARQGIDDRGPGDQYRRLANVSPLVSRRNIEARNEQRRYRATR